MDSPNQSPDIPEAPSVGRHFELYPLHLIGMLAMLAIVVMALFGVFGRTMGEGSAVSQALTRDDYSLTNAIIAVTTLLVLVYATSLLSQRSKRAELILTGVPTVLIKQGEFISANLAKERVTPDEVFSEMHKAGMYDLRQIKWAILEGDGKIAFIPEDLAKHPQLLHKKMQDESALS